MDQVFDRVGGRFRISITDSTMMKILHSAMDKSHEKAKSKEGFLERLSEISNFYQLAVIQLEGCLKFIQEETDHNGFETGDEEVLADLTDIRDRLAGRLKESEIAISEKDREFKERMENEWKLRQALEIKERKLESLRKNLELERTKSEGIEELILGNRLSIDEERDEQFSELKSSVEQQVWNIKQKLDRDHIDRRSYQNFHDMKIDQMSSDIDILKETMDLAFGKMHCAMILSELEPVERQQGLMIEKDVEDIIFKGFLEDIYGNFQAEVGNREKQFSIGLSGYLSDLEREMHYLRAELDPHGTAQESPERKNSLKSTGRSSSESSTEMREDDGDSHYVAKMIKNHESIIRRKSEEMNSPKREILKERKNSSWREEKEPVSPRRKIQDVFTVLENLITWNEKLGGEFNHSGDDGFRKIYSEKSLSEFGMTDQAKSQFDTLDDVWEKVNRNPVCQSEKAEDLKSQISNLKMEKEEVNLQNMITEMLHQTLLEGFMHDCRTQLNCYSLNLAENNKNYEDSLKKIITECEKHEKEKIESENREEKHSVVFSEVVRDLSSSLNYALTETLHLNAKINSLEDEVFEKKLEEEISRIRFREMSNEWNEATKTSQTEYLAKQEIYQIVFEEIIRDVINTGNQMEEAFLETLIREESYQLIFLGAVEEANAAFAVQQSLIQRQNSYKKDYNEENLILNSCSNRKECTAELLKEIKCSSISVSREIEKAAEQLDISRRLLSLLRSSLNVGDEMHCFDHEELFQSFLNFKSMVEERLEFDTSRLENITHKLNPISESIASLKSKEMMYKKAFDRRCENLRTAETEVDLLGDQVELLLDLLEKIHKTLLHNSPELQQYLNVSDILTMMEKELEGIHVSNNRQYTFRTYPHA